MLNYVMILNAPDLTIHAVNQAFTDLLARRDVSGLPISEVFSGHDVNELIRVLKRAVRDGQLINTPPIQASVDGR